VSEERRLGYIEDSPDIFKRIESLGVPARIWDEVIGEMFDLHAWSHLPGAFDQIWTDWHYLKGREYDYTRAQGVSDRDYVRGLLLQAESDLVQSNARYPHALDEGILPGLDVPED
jgi:hypothetical protein